MHVVAADSGALGAHLPRSLGRPRVLITKFDVLMHPIANRLHARHTRDRLPLLTSLELCVLAARAAGVAALDGVHLDLDDDAGFEAACRQAADLGFDGKTLIHPKTIAKANEIFAPAASEIDWSRRVIAAHAEAVAQGRGLVVLDGRLIEDLHVEDAQRVVGLAEAIETLASGLPGA